MAGEWIPYDVCLPQKPEVLELVDATGLPADQALLGQSFLRQFDVKLREKDMVLMPRAQP